jgi:hypothetical protein
MVLSFGLPIFHGFFSVCEFFVPTAVADSTDDFGCLRQLSLVLEQTSTVQMHVGQIQREGCRDHNPHDFTYFLAGGGVKPGISYSSTDDYGFDAEKDKVHFHDLHATMLHLLGLDHKRLTYKHAGRDFRLTDVHGEVVNGILA